MPNNKLPNAAKFKRVMELVDSGISITKVSRESGVPRTTVRLWVSDRARFTSLLQGGSVVTGVPSKEELLTEQVRALKAQINSAKKSTLDDHFVKSQIFGLKDALATETLNLPKWMFKPPRKLPDSFPGVPTLFASDWHWWEYVDKDQIGGVNEYDAEIAHSRARALIEKTIDLCKNHMVNPKYPGIVFALGGDMVSGDIHEELSNTNEGEMMPCIVDLVTVLIWCIKTLANEFDNVFIPCVTGNHGRNTRKMRAKSRNYTNFDWLVYQWLSLHFEDDERIQFYIPSGSDALFQIYSHRYLLSHGDQFRGGDGMIGPLGPITRGDHKKRSRNSQTNQEYDTLMIGHWHQLIQLRKLIVNSSLKGYDEYAYQNNFPFEPPCQALWFTHPKWGITFSAPVYVEQPITGDSQDWVAWNMIK